MVKEIIKQRYQKFTIAVMIVILGYFAVSCGLAVQSWHSNQNYLNSEVYAKTFKEYPNVYYYDEGDGKQKEYHYTLAEDIEINSYFFELNQRGEDDFQHYHQKLITKKIAKNESYFSTYLNQGEILLILLIGIVGFSLFFVDQKTAFNRFLFSLPVKRSQLFLGKLRYVALPILASYLVGGIVLIAGLEIGIPAPFLNISLSTLLQALGMHLLTVFFIFAISCFMGIMLGNLLFGTLTYLVFMGSLYYLSQGISYFADFVYVLLHGKLPDGDNIGYAGYLLNPQRFFQMNIDKNLASWSATLILVVVGLLALFWGYRKYQSLSLEHEGEYLLYPESRKGIFVLIFTYLCFYGHFIFSSPWIEYLLYQPNEYYTRGELFTHSLITSLVLIGIALFIPAILLYFGEMRKWLGEKRQAWQLKNSHQ